MPSLALTPRGHLLYARVADEEPATEAGSTLERAFERGSGHGLLALGTTEVGTTLPTDVSYWRDVAARLIAVICTHPDFQSQTPIPPPSPTDLNELVAAVPPMDGAEYLTVEVLERLWGETADAFRVELAESPLSVQEFLQQKNAAWHLVGRVHFNLAENRRDDEAPFAFLATYTTHLTKSVKAQHLPLGRALSEYAGAANKAALLSLLLPVRRAAAECPWLKRMVDAGEIHQPLRWTPGEAFQLLTDVASSRGCGSHRAGTERLEGKSSTAPASHGDGRRQAAVRPGCTRHCSNSR